MAQNEAALRAGREKSWQDRCSRTIKDIRVTEARGEVSEDDKKRNRPTCETETPKSDDCASGHDCLSSGAPKRAAHQPR